MLINITCESHAPPSPGAHGDPMYIKEKLDKRLAPDLVTVYGSNFASGEDTDTNSAWKVEEDRGMTLLSDLRLKSSHLMFLQPIAAAICCTDVEKPEYCPHMLVEAVRRANEQGLDMGYHINEHALTRKLDTLHAGAHYSTMKDIYCNSNLDKSETVNLGLLPDESQQRFVDLSFWGYLKGKLMCEDSTNDCSTFISASQPLESLLGEPWNQEFKDLVMLNDPEKHASQTLKDLVTKYQEGKELKLHKPLTLFGSGMALMKRATDVIERMAAEEGHRSDVKLLSDLATGVQVPIMSDLMLHGNIYIDSPNYTLQHSTPHHGYHI